MLRKIFSQDQAQVNAEAYRNLIRKEAVIGGQLFHKTAGNRNHQFFCLDEHTWVWHEEWQDSARQNHSRTTRYIIRPTGAAKTHDGRTYHPISPSESRNLREAISIYYKRVMRELYAQPV